MKINELLVESQLDEISLGGIASGIGKGLGTVRNAFSQGADGYNDKRQEYLDQRAAQLAARAGQTPAAPAGQAPATGTAPAGQAPATGTAPAAPAGQAPATGTAPAPAGQAPAAPAADSAYKQALAAIDKLDSTRKKRVLAQLQKKLGTAPAAPAGQAPATGTAPAAPASTGLPPGVNPEKANAAQQAAGLPPLYKKTADGGSEETDQAKGTWTGTAKNLKVVPGGKPAAPAAPTQAELDADQARMATGTNESKQPVFRSKFLGIDL